MSSVTVRNISEETHRALKTRAIQNGRSTEAEIRSILDSAVRPPVRLGDALAAIGRSVGGVELKLQRDKKPVKAASFD